MDGWMDGWLVGWLFGWCSYLDNQAVMQSHIDAGTESRLDGCLDSVVQ